jgi:recombination protein RecA
MAKSKKKTAEQKPKKTSDDPLEAAIAEIEEKFGEEALQIGMNTFIDVDAMSTGLLSVDLALGCRGVPRGRIIEIYGNESSGKTTFTLQIIATIQAAGGIAAFIDAEHALDPGWAEDIGVDLEKLIISQPDSGEQGLQIVDALVKNKAVDVIIVDSVAALVPKAEIDGEVGDHHIGAQARMLSQALRKLVSVAKKGKTTIIFINQLREKIGVIHGNPETTPGGRALKFYSSIRMELRRMAAIKAGDDAIGNQVRLRVVKNKVAPPFQNVEFNIMFGHRKQPGGPTKGPDRLEALVTGAMSMDVLERRGSNYYFGEQRVGIGKDKTVEAVRSDPELYDQIYQRTLDALDPSKMKRGSEEEDKDTREDVDVLASMMED